MSNLLNQVKDACCSLDSSKVTERKKAEEKLRDLLNNRSTIQSLDKATSEENKWGWEDVYRATFNFLKKETEKLVEDEGKEKQAKSAESSRNTKKRIAISIFKKVLRNAGKYLQWHSVVDDLLRMLDHPYMLQHFCDDVVRILLDIINTPSSRDVLKAGMAHQWESLLEACIKLFKNAPPALDCFASCKLLRLTIEQGCQYSNLQNMLFSKNMWTLLRFLLVKDKISHGSTAKLEVIKAATVFIQNVAIDCRNTACKFGEETIQFVIQSWDERTSGSEAVLQFLRLQMSLHNPNGVTSLEEGAYWDDENVWIHQLARMYQNIVETTIKNRLRQCRTKGSKASVDYELQPMLLDLSIEICHQLMVGGGEVHDVTQIANLDETQGPTAKRRRMDGPNGDSGKGVVNVSLDNLIEELQSSVAGDNYQVKIPWLQLLTGLVGRYPDSIDPAKLPALTRCLAGLMQNTKTVATRRHILSACERLLFGIKDVTSSSGWEVIERTCLHMLSMNQAGPEGHRLINSLLRIKGTRMPSLQNYSLYANRIVHLSPESLETLLVLMTTNPIQDKLVLGKGIDDLRGEEIKSLRMELLHWLFPESNDGDGSIDRIERGNPELLANILFNLALTKQTGDQSLLNKVQVQNRTNVELEEKLLENSLVKSINFGGKPDTMKKISILKPTVLQEVLQKIQELLIQEGAEILEELGCNKPDKIITAVRHARLVQIYLGKLESLSCSNVTTSRLEILFKSIVAKAASFTELIVDRDPDRCVNLITVLQEWNLLVQDANNLSRNIQIFLRKADTFPLTMLDKIDWLIADECKKRENHGKANASQAKEINPFADLDETTNGRKSPDEFDDFENFQADVGNSQDDTEVDFTMGQNNIDPIEDKMRLDCIQEALNLLVNYSAPVSDLERSSPDMKIRQRNCAATLHAVLEIYDYDESSLDVFFDTSESLAKSRLITEDAIEDVVNLYTTIARRCLSKKVFNHAAISKLLSLLVHLFLPVHNEGSDGNKQDLIRMIGGLVKLNSFSCYYRLSPHLTSQIVEAIEQAGMVDPQLSWTTWDPRIHNIVSSKDTAMDIDSDEEISIKNCLSRFLFNPSQIVRAAAAKAIVRLQKNSSTTISKTKLIEYQRALTLPLQETIPDFLAIDSKRVLVGSGLALLAGLVSASPSNTRELISGALQFSQEQRVNNETLLTVINLISQLRAVDRGDMIVSMLAGIWDDYLKRGGSIDNFPKFLLGCRDTAQFASKFENTVFPFALLHSPSDETLQNYSALLNKTPSALIQDNFKYLAMLFLPSFAAAERSIKIPGMERNKKLANFIHEKSDDFVALISQSCERALLLTFLHVNDNQTLQEKFQIKIFHSNRDNPPHFKAEIPAIMVDYFGDLFSEEGAIWQKMSEKKPSSIVSMAVELTAALRTSCQQKEQQLQSLFSIDLWLESLSPTISSGGLKEVTPFLTWFLTNSFLNFLKVNKEESDLARATLIVLQRFVSTMTLADDVSVSKCLMSINSCLVTISESEEESVSELALKILHFLIIDCGKKFKEIIAKFDIYPDNVTFSLLQSEATRHQTGRDESLKGYSLRFLEVPKSIDPISQVRSLNMFAEKLAVSAPSLAKLLNEESLLMRKVVLKLVNMASSSDDSVSIAATKCIGEIGPSNLNSETLCTNKSSQISEFHNTPSRVYVASIVLKLTDLLISNDAEVSMNANKALKNVLYYTEEGAKLTENELGDKFSICQPFMHGTKSKPSKLKVDEAKFRDKLDNLSVWIPSEGSHEEWIINLVVTMLECFNNNCVLGYLINVCRIQSSLCEAILPFIFHEILLQADCVELRLILSSKMGLFFENHFKFQAEININRPGTPMQQQTKSDTPSFMRPTSISTLLAVISYLRQHKLPHHLVRSTNVTTWENNFWLDLNYLHLARASLSCSAFFSAALFVSVWCFQKEMECKDIKTEVFKDTNLIEKVATHFPEQGQEAQNILFATCISLGDLEASSGAGRARLVKAETRTDQLALEGKYSSALPMYNIQASMGNLSAKHGLVASLHESGMHYTLSTFLNSNLSNESDDLDMLDYQRQCNWRLEQWDSPCEVMKPTINGCFLGGLQGAVRGELETVSHWVHEGRKLIAEALKATSKETTAEIYPLFSHLRQLQELEAITQSSGESLSLIKCFNNLRERDAIQPISFKLTEPTLTQRTILLSSTKWTGGAVKKAAKLNLQSSSLNLSRKAREAGMFWVSEQQLSDFFCGQQGENILKARFEESRLAWAQDERETAQFLAKKLFQDIEAMDNMTVEANALQPDLILTMGQWHDEQKTEASQKILEDYLLKATKLYESEPASVQSEKVYSAYLAVAKFADSQYQLVNEYLSSAEMMEKTETIKNTRKEVEILQDTARIKGEDVGTALAIKKRFTQLDEMEVQQLDEKKQGYLKISLEYYLKVMNYGQENLAIYRLVSLWFSNDDDEMTNSFLAENLPKVPSYKFIPLLYQMAARMQLGVRDTKSFGYALNGILRRCLEGHPHHTLPIVMALKNAKADKDNKSSDDDEKTQAANKLLSEASSEPSLRQLIDKYLTLCLALIDLAYIGSKETKSQIPIPRTAAILKPDNWESVAVLTDTIPVRRDKDYSDITGIVKFKSHYGYVGGIQFPKKCYCLGTDGRHRTQLVKGKDDLRQDAVMQQVFGLMTSLLNKDAKSRRLNLSVRTYKVVPLSQRSGILEWCENTQPLAIYLVGSDGKSGAHKRYYPKDWNGTARQKMAAISGNPSAPGYRPTTLKKKVEVFEEVCRNFSPVMKFFFLENFPSAGDYWLRRTAYTRSAATNSMVGHILGLGDRHPSNILIDNNTGELIHIDLGIAFDQGKVLPVPEKVPFRLTRDIVDGFGPTGVEGTYRRACELSMRVLRENREAILTVLEVMVHDPMYNWSVGPSKVATRQAGQWEKLQQNQSGNRMANRALMVLKAKLDGREGGTPMSVEGQVNKLIQEATDPENLCSIFAGWQPWI